MQLPSPIYLHQWLLSPLYEHDLIVSAVRQSSRLAVDVGLSHFFIALTNLIGARRVHITAYHPAVNGTVERFYRQLN